MDSPIPARSRALLPAALFLLAAAPYLRILPHPFLDYDEVLLVTGNRHVLDGLSWRGAAWAFSTLEGFNWHPLTWLSHMADVELFGLDPRGHHLVTIGMHGLNAVLLFLFLDRSTGRPWRSAFAAALFAVHPLHAESVAWLAERKDVLSTLFTFAALVAYGRYAERPGRLRLLAVALLFACALMAKPMAVTFPFLLLLLDRWPLARREGGGVGGARPLPPRSLVAEKLPLFAMSAGACVVTYLAQEAGRSVSSLEALPLSLRLANGVVSYGRYLLKALWPASLSPFYPYPEGGIAAGKAAAAAAFLAASTAVCLRLARRLPYLPAGWFWFLGTLVPVIGIVQVGPQAMADRYTYVPLAGIFVAVAWGGAETAAALRANRGAVGAAALAALALLSALAWRQAGYWRDSATLFARALEVTEDNWFARYNLGKVLGDAGRHEEAAAQFREALRLRPGCVECRINLGVAEHSLGRYAEAARNYREAIRLDPRRPAAWNHLGVAEGTLGNYGGSERALREAVRLRPGYSEAWGNLAETLRLLGKAEEAAAARQAALRPDPEALIPGKGPSTGR